MESNITMESSETYGMADKADSITGTVADRADGNKRRLLQHSDQVIIFLIIYDCIAVSLSFLIALLLRFDFRYSQIPDDMLLSWAGFTPFYVIFCVVVFWMLHLYKSIWRFASFTELKRIMLATFITCLIHFMFITLLFETMPAAYYVVGALLQFFFVAGIRFMYRFVLLLRSDRVKFMVHVDNVMLVGAGSAGQMILRDIKRAGEVNERVVCIIDDNKNGVSR